VVRELHILASETDVKMIGGINSLSPLRLSIIAETKVFLRGLKTGASNEQLRAIIQRIRDKERQLLHQEGAVLDPEMWRILYNRLINRNVKFVDPNY
jgi:hypothetical protein